MLEASQVAYGLLQAKARQRVDERLGTRVTGDNELPLLARLFHGGARWRGTSAGLRFTALLSDAGLQTPATFGCHGRSQDPSPRSLAFFVQAAFV